VWYRTRTYKRFKGGDYEVVSSKLEVLVSRVLRRRVHVTNEPGIPTFSSYNSLNMDLIAVFIHSNSFDVGSACSIEWECILHIRSNAPCNMVSSSSPLVIVDIDLQSMSCSNAPGLSLSISIVFATFKADLISSGVLR